MNSTFLNFLLAVVIVVFAAKLAGYVSVRLGQPSVLGELLAGILLGPTVFNLLHAVPAFVEDPLVGELLAVMAEVGVVLLMFLAGLELALSELLRSGRVASLAGTLGVIVPLVISALTAALFSTTWVQALFIGLALSATSVSISAQTLMELGVLRSRVGLGLLGAAVFDDILVILLLSIATILLGSEAGAGGVAILLTVLQMLLFLAAAVALGFWGIPRLVPVVERLPISQGLLVFAVLTAFIFGWAAEVIGGVAAITGAFLAGLFFARTHAVREIEQGVAVLAYGFFVPIFFVNIGLEANLRGISGSDWVFALVLTAVAILTKIIGSGAGAFLGGFNRKDALRVGLGMVSRGEVGLIVASVALAQGFLEQSTFSILVFIIIVATLVTPPLLRSAYNDRVAEVSA